MADSIFDTSKNKEFNFKHFVEQATNGDVELRGLNLLFTLRQRENTPIIRVGGTVQHLGFKTISNVQGIAIYIRFLGGSEIAFKSFSDVELIELFDNGNAEM